MKTDFVIPIELHAGIAYAFFAYRWAMGWRQMADEKRGRLGLTDDEIKDLAYRLAGHLREELGDRLTPLQRIYDEKRRLRLVKNEADET